MRNADLGVSIETATVRERANRDATVRERAKRNCEWRIQNGELAGPLLSLFAIRYSLGIMGQVRRPVLGGVTPRIRSKHAAKPA